MSELEQFRKEKDRFFRENPQSPLTRAQKKQFTGLAYFPEYPELRLIVDIEDISGHPLIEMQTSTGEIQTYERFGKFRFLVVDQPAVLTIFADEHGFFLPFVDALANTQTYPAGRYLEPESLGDNRFLVDFNYAYNPYCAYNDLYSCPLTPWENRLKVGIPAGEKLFPLKDH